MSQKRQSQGAVDQSVSDNEGEPADVKSELLKPVTQQDVPAQGNHQEHLPELQVRPPHTQDHQPANAYRRCNRESNEQDNGMEDSQAARQHKQRKPSDITSINSREARTRLQVGARVGDHLRHLPLSFLSATS